MLYAKLLLKEEKRKYKLNKSTEALKLLTTPLEVWCVIIQRWTMKNQHRILCTQCTASTPIRQMTMLSQDT